MIILGNNKSDRRCAEQAALSPAFIAVWATETFDSAVQVIKGFSNRPSFLGANVGKTPIGTTVPVDQHTQWLALVMLVVLDSKALDYFLHDGWFYDIRLVLDLHLLTHLHATLI
jgi:hypothetical protein